MDFPSIVRELYPDLAPTIRIEPDTCPDQYVGCISQIVNDKRIDPLCRQPASSRPSGRAVLLVLESPHIKEFEKGVVGNPSPARGPTGTNIANYIDKVPGLENTADRPLILINAVQFQCSLGKPVKCFRDSVFREVWNDGRRDDFVARLSKIYRKGDLVVCSCTRGVGSPKEHLRQLVYDAIVGEIKTMGVLCRTHPSGWHYSRNRSHLWQPI